MDLADKAQEQSDLDLSIALIKRKAELTEKGSCHWCEEPIEKGVFCDSDCRADYEKSKIMRG